MFKEKFQMIKDKLKISEGDNNKKKIENLVVFVIILIVTIIIINVIWKTDKSENKKIESTTDKILAQSDTNIKINNMNNMNNSTNTDLEEKLENILEQISGVGKVKVLVTYSESSQTMAMYNEDRSESDTEETDKQGGNRKVSQSSTKKEVIYQEIDGEKIPITQSVIQPKIEGAIITAVGAKNSNIKTDIIQAVEAATGLATHKIQVFEMINN